MGRWVYDCGHPPYETEIHPVIATAFGHTEPAMIAGLKVPSIATVTHLWIDGRGGYYDSPVPSGDGHYRFDVTMPPKPSNDGIAYTQVLQRFDDAEKLAPLSNPKLTVDYGNNPNQPVLHIDYDLSSVTPSADHLYGLVIGSGWVEKTTSETYHKLRVSMDSINIRDCHDCNNWSLWEHIGTHWQVLADPFRSGAKPFCDIGKNDPGNPNNPCPPIGIVPFGPNSFIDLIVPSSQQALLVSTSGFSWSEGENIFGVVPQNTLDEGQYERMIIQRVHHDEGDITNRALFGYKGLMYTDAARAFVHDMLTGVKLGDVNRYFGSTMNFGAGMSGCCNDISSANDYNIAYHIDDMGTIPKGTPTGSTLPPCFPDCMRIHPAPTTSVCVPFCTKAQSNISTKVITQPTPQTFHLPLVHDHLSTNILHNQAINSTRNNESSVRERFAIVPQ